MFFSTRPSVADGFLLRTWRGGPLVGQPKLPAVAQGLVERGLMRVDAASLRLPRLFFTDPGLVALRAMVSDARLAKPTKFAHVRRNSASTQPRHKLTPQKGCLSPVLRRWQDPQPTRRGFDQRGTLARGPCQPCQGAFRWPRMAPHPAIEEGGRIGKWTLRGRGSGHRDLLCSRPPPRLRPGTTGCDTALSSRSPLPSLAVSGEQTRRRWTKLREWLDSSWTSPSPSSHLKERS